MDGAVMFVTFLQTQSGKIEEKSDLQPLQRHMLIVAVNFALSDIDYEAW